MDKLELSIETLRELSEDELTHVAGGQRIPPLTGNETYYCPTQATNPVIACGNLSLKCGQ